MSFQCTCPEIDKARVLPILNLFNSYIVKLHTSPYVSSFVIASTKCESIQALEICSSNSVVCAGKFSGSVLCVSGGIVVQKTHRDGSFVLHAISCLSRFVETGEILDIEYVDGVGVVEDVAS